MTRNGESYLMDRVLDELRRFPGVKAWRQNTGVYRSLDGKRVVRVSVKGAADLTGILPDGRRLEVEVKVPEGELRPEQVEFGKMIADSGGVYIIARAPGEATAALRELGYGQ